MVVLMIGDVIGQAGCDHVRKVLPGLKRFYHVDAVIANGENSAEGNGILPASARHLFDSGVDVITGGNHVLRRRQIYDLLDQEQGLIRPANYHKSAPGAGVFYHDAVRYRLCVINLQGIAYMQNIENPFNCIDALLKTVDTPNIIVDFHAEATSEKIAMGQYLDGRVSVVAGTHTHVPTNDIQILPGGTGYLTDLGMVGGARSVLGVEAKAAMYKLRTGLPCQFENDPRDIRLSGALFTLDEATGKCKSAESLVGIV